MVDYRAWKGQNKMHLKHLYVSESKELLKTGVLSKERLGRKPPRAPQLEETPETPPSSRAEGLLFLHGLESNPGSSLQTEEEAGLP